MLKAHIGNRDSIGLLEFRHACVDKGVSGVVTDDDGVKYRMNVFGVIIDSAEHPAAKLHEALSNNLMQKRMKMRRVENTASSTTKARHNKLAHSTSN